MTAQRSKSKKRAKSWHRGKAEAWQWRQVKLPDTGITTAYTGEPERLPRGSSWKPRGEAC